METTKRQPSKLYAIKSFRAAVKKLEAVGLTTYEETQTLKNLTNKIAENYLNHHE